MTGRLPAGGGGGGGTGDRVSKVGGEESGLEWIDLGRNADNNWPVVKDAIWPILQGYFRCMLNEWLHP
jgi:hypothetical protein